MLNIDIIAITLLTLYFVGGWHFALFRSLIGPGSFLLSYTIAVINYDLMSNPIIATIVCVTGTVGLTIALNILFIAAQMSVDKKYRNYTLWINRLAGGLISVAWNGLLTVMAVIIFMILPDNGGPVSKIQTEINTSWSYGYANAFIVPRVPKLNTLALGLLVFKDPSHFAAVADTNEYHDFFNNPRLQAILTDNETLDQIEQRDILRLMKNPKVHAAINDTGLINSTSRLILLMYHRQKESPSS